MIAAIMLMVSSCTTDSRDQYEVVGIDNKTSEEVVKYELRNMSMPYDHDRIYDTSGKFKVGDTVRITMKKQ